MDTIKHTPATEIESAEAQEMTDARRDARRGLIACATAVVLISAHILYYAFV